MFIIIMIYYYCCCYYLYVPWHEMFLENLVFSDTACK